MKAILLAVALLGGCAASARQIDEKMDTWVGVESSHLMKHWGPPNATADLDGGTKLFSYGQHCTITFAVGPEKTVTTANWRGGRNRCDKESLWAPKALRVAD